MKVIARLSSFSLPIFLLLAPMVAKSQVYPFTYGSVVLPTIHNVGSIALSRGQFPNIRLSSSQPIQSNNPIVVLKGPSQAQVTVSPQATLDFDTTDGGFTYRGMPYNVSHIRMVFTGSPVTSTTAAANSFTVGVEFNNIPFSMTGTLTACVGTTRVCSGPYEQIAISGTGIYTGAMQWYVPCGCVNSGSTAYQFGPAGFILDTTTQGNWQGVYGMDGHVIAGDAADSSNPGYAALSVQGAFPYTWTGPGLGTNARALEVGNGERIASAFTSHTGNSFNINIAFTDNVPHRVALYLLDWDTSGRQEQITVQQNGVVVDTEPNDPFQSGISGFHNGQWVSWNLSGNVVITVTPIGPASSTNPDTAVVSGIFFGAGLLN